GNYTVADGSTTANITPKQLTISGSKVNSKIYDGNATASITFGMPSGVISGDTVTVSASGTFANAQTGANKNVTVTYSLSGADAGNYTAPASQTLTGTIVEAPSMVVTTADDGVADPYDNKITLREALGVYYKTDGTISGYDGEVTYNTGSNKTVTFASGLTTMNPSSGYTLTGTHDGLVIDAKSGRQSNIVFDGQTFIIFTQTGAADVTLKGITFQNISASSGHGTGYSCTLGFATGASCGKTVTLEDCTFSGNSNSGGATAVAVIGINALIKNSTFSSNTGYHSPVRSGFGALTVQGSTFTGNTSNGNGGAVSFDFESPDTPSGVVTITGSTFTNNSTSYDGGAIYSAAKTISISGSTFTSNTAASDGGAFATPGDANQTKTIVVNNCEFTGNRANGGAGGAMLIENYGANTLTMTGTTFTNNTASTTGGALRLNGCTFQIKDQSKFIGNTAAVGGGAVHVGYGGSSSISSTEFKENKATRAGDVSGGAILFENNNGVVTISGSAFKDNYANATNGTAFGGAISRSTGTNDGGLSISSTSFTGNYLSATNGTYGGAIYSNAPTTSFTGGTFSGNKAPTGNGGAICVTGGTKLSVSGTTFQSNEAINAGAIYSTLPTTEISGGTFSGNKATNGNGGAICVTDGNKLSVSNAATFENNVAVNGGA
ncbi:MAG: hypothetical protein J6S40_09715, partial [Thermoguttaceae bacterium]|nr:hypothetical protein [Thermoguttaceae bacterium]